MVSSNTSASLEENKLFYIYPEELYEWDDFMRYFPIMQGNYSMHPIFWKIYAYSIEKNKEHN